MRTGALRVCTALPFAGISPGVMAPVLPVPKGRGGFACDLTAGLTPTAVLLPLPSAALGGGP